MTTVTTAELAAQVGVSDRTVRELARRGIFVQTGRGRFDQEASLLAYCAHLRREKSGKRGGGAVFADAGNERTRLAAAQADAQEMKNKVAAGKLLPEAEIETVWTELVLATRNAILATPARIQSDLPHLTAYDVSIIDKALREALTRLGSGS